MKALQQRAYGLDGLSSADVPAPVAGPGKVLVAVRAAGVDRGAWHLVTGRPGAVRLGTGLRRPRRAVPGAELAGVVEAVGAGVTGFAPGDEVYGTAPGAFAEQAVAPPKTLARKPSGLTFEQAAALPVSGVTALGALDAAGVTAGGRVLVLGAGGGVGSLVVLLAKARGAHVTGESSSAKTAFVASLGADEVVDRAVVDACDGTHTFDAVVDTAGNRPVRVLRRALAPRGALVVVGGEGKGGPLGGFSRQLRVMLLAPFVRQQRLRALTSLTTAAALDALRAEVERAGLRPPVDTVLPLADGARALARVESGQVCGKVVLAV